MKMSVQVIAPAVAGEPPGRRGGRVCRSKVVVPRRRRGQSHFGSGHPLAQVARVRCEQAHAVPVSARLGELACGQCWELVIRTDERVAAEYELPPLTGDDASIVDEVAVERAVRGKQVRLTRSEKAEAVARLAAASCSAVVIAVRLRMNTAEVGKLWPTAVELAVRGKRVQLTPVEKAEAVARLAADGRSPIVVAARLRMSVGEVVTLWPAPVCVDRQVT
jgi:hypothetical protein